MGEETALREDAGEVEAGGGEGGEGEDGAVPFKVSRARHVIRCCCGRCCLIMCHFLFHERKLERGLFTAPSAF